MLVGRQEERKQLETLLDDARAGRSGALVLRGEAGIGKTALLEFAVDTAEGFRVLRALGVESEAELAYAGLQQLLLPAMDTLAELPPLQTRALGTALAIEEGPPPERLAVSAATLGLLAGVAEERPLLCAVDDAHWLDQGSADALTFAARRLQAEGVAMLFTAREPETAVFLAPGIPELSLRGLAATEASALLAASAPDLAQPAADRLIELSRGNPLALLEIPRAMSKEHQTGRKPLEAPLPVGAEIERAFQARAATLSGAARHALLIVAAGDPSDADALWRALGASSLDGDAVAEAEAAGLLRPGGLDFCHPLARSAVYQIARPADRRAAHASLAVVTTEPDRRAWQLAAAADGPDETAAAALEHAAEAARRRGGPAAEARALERAAQLTTEAELRASRLLKAAVATQAAGRLEHAETMLVEAGELTEDRKLQARVIAQRSHLLEVRGEADGAYALAVAAAEGAEAAEAAFILTAAVTPLCHRLEIGAALETAERAWRLAGPTAVENLDLCVELAWARTLAGRFDDVLPMARSVVEHADPGSRLVTEAGTILLYLEDYAPAREVLEGVVARARDAGAPGVLYYALDQLAKLETRVAKLQRAYALELESVQMTEPLGTQVGLAASLSWLAGVEAMLGRDESRAHAQAALRNAEDRSDAYNVVRARGALGLQALARGDPAEAAEWLRPAATMVADGGVGNPNWFRLDADLVEALARLGRPDEAEPHLARLENQARSTGSDWGLAAAARCRALIGPDTEVVDAFETALSLPEHDRNAFERARTELCYGERLRRSRRRRAAREQLRSSLATFDRLAARPWAERARVELRATGEHLRRRDPTAAEQLTPQEFQIALLVAEGLTNRDVGARLYLSPKTVEFHLGHAFRKLGVRSRGQLIKLFASQAPEGPSMESSTSGRAG